MKKFKRIFCVLGLALCLSVVGAMAAACDPGDPSFGSDSSGSGSSSSAPQVTTYTVTFDYNYDDADSSVVEVEEGQQVSEPTPDPTRDGYTFDDWYADEDCTLPYDFSTPVTGDVTIYANWLEDGVTYYDVTLHYENGEDPVTLRVRENSRVSQPVAPEREGYVFEGWYSDEEYSSRFIFSTRITENTQLYAKWLQLSVFEAEDLDMSQMSGPGYSGASYGTDMILEDVYGANASGGEYVSYLYAKYDNATYNTTLEFHITADKAVSGGQLILRLSAEYVDIVIDGDDYEVLVNGVKIGYDNITFTGAAAATEAKSLLAFRDYTITTSLSLAEGDNVITLRTANTRKQGSGGTMNSTAPLVDCIKIAAEDVTLTWTE